MIINEQWRTGRMKLLFRHVHLFFTVFIHSFIYSLGAAAVYFPVRKEKTQQTMNLFLSVFTDF